MIATNQRPAGEAGLTWMPPLFLLLDDDEADELELEEDAELPELLEFEEPVDLALAVAEDSLAWQDEAWLVEDAKDAEPLKEQSDLFLPFFW